MPECPWCEAIKANRFWHIPPSDKHLCADHAALWPQAAATCILFISNCVTKAKLVEVLTSIRKSAVEICGKTIVKGPKGLVLKDIAPQPEPEVQS